MTNGIIANGAPIRLDAFNLSFKTIRVAILEIDENNFSMLCVGDDIREM
jgi:hypothetical protein